MVLFCLHGSEMLSLNMAQNTNQIYPNNPNRSVQPEPKNIWTNANKVRAKDLSQSSSSEEDQSSAHKKRSTSEQDQPQHDPDPLFYREVVMAELPSQYAEEVETFRHILDLPDPREICLGLPLRFWAWMTKKTDRSLGQEAPQLCSLSALISKMLLINLRDFLASNLTEGKYIKPPSSTANW